MKKGYAFLLVIILLVAFTSCKKILGIRDDPYPFVNGKRSKLVCLYPQDANGYYLVPIDTTTNSNTFDVYLEASKLIPFYAYNGSFVIQSSFDSDSWWVLGAGGGDLVVTIPLYSPFTSLYSSPYFSVPLPVKDTTITLSQFRNSIVRIVQESGVYLKEYFAGNMYQPADEYRPEDGMYWGKRIVGPIPKYFVGDTVTIYSQMYWDAGNYTYTHPNETLKVDSVKAIFKIR